MRYPGGKGKCYQRLINLMPPHHTYIESHLGGGAVMRHKKPATRNIGLDLDPKVIERWRAEYPDVCALHETDALEFLQKYDFRGDELLYVDPPYVPETRRRKKVYRYDYSCDDHLRLLRLLTTLPCNIMISGYTSELYETELAGWQKVSFPAKTHVDVREESVWMNFQPKGRLHDTRYLGDNYRDRQTIQRRQARLRSRIDRMAPAERYDLLQWMQENYETTQRAP